MINPDLNIPVALTNWSSLAPTGGAMTIEGDEVYTRMDESLSSRQGSGWTIHFIKYQAH
jgi:hypothetical protein